MNIGDALGKIWTNAIGEYTWGQELLDVINPHLGPGQQLTLNDNGVVLLGRFDALPKDVQCQLLVIPIASSPGVIGSPASNGVPTPVPFRVPVPYAVPTPTPQGDTATPVPTPAPDFPVGYVKSWRSAVIMLIGLGFVTMAGIGAMNVEILSSHVHGQFPTETNVVIRWIADVLETLSADMSKGHKLDKPPDNAGSGSDKNQGTDSAPSPGSQ